MTWNTRNSKDRSIESQNRRNYKLSIAWTWLLANCPDIAAACEHEAELRFPKLQKNCRKVGNEVMEAVKRIKFTGEIHAK